MREGSTLPPRPRATLQPTPNRDGGEQRNGLQPPPNEPATPPQPCTLETYAKTKALPVELLREVGLSTVSYMGSKAVRMPYLTEDGGEGAVHLRLALEKSSQGDNRFRWRKGSRPILYGLWRMKRVRDAGYVVLVEGESDCHTLWRHGIEALGVPGASNWKPEWSEQLTGIEKVYAIVEPDEGGEALKGRLSASTALRDRLRFVELGKADDVSALYLSDLDRFMDSLRAAFGRARLWADEVRAGEEFRI